MRTTLAKYKWVHGNWLFRHEAIEVQQTADGWYARRKWDDVTVLCGPHKTQEEAERGLLNWFEMQT